MWASIQRMKGRRAGPLSDSEFVGRFERSAAPPADHSRAVSAGEGIIDFFGAVRAVERLSGVRCWILRAGRHEEENCSIEAGDSLLREDPGIRTSSGSPGEIPGAIARRAAAHAIAGTSIEAEF